MCWLAVTPAGPIATLWLNSIRKAVVLNGFAPECSHHCERFFSCLNCQFLENKVSKRIEHLVRVLVEKVGPFYENKCSPTNSSVSEVLRVRGREKSAWDIVQNEWITVLDSIMGIGTIRSSANEAVHYLVGLKPAFCTCLDIDGVLCKHVRALARVLGGLELWGLHTFDALHTSPPFAVPQLSMMGATCNAGLALAAPDPNPPLAEKTCAGMEAGYDLSPLGPVCLGVEPVCNSGPDLELCDAWHRLCADQSITSDVLHDMLGMISRTRQQSLHSRMDIIIASEELLCKSIKNTRSGATLDAFEKMVCDTLKSQECARRNAANKRKATENPCQPDSHADIHLAKKAN